ncbi:hypothetical protein J2T60_000168 [Natronospira proteinivora]|uniref:Nucleotide-diphospho-sugar transferase n=1 Tax=Natronospira proteinivora TaxID=1807133 RepID=A0ABT1G7A1_9GAMM|nr:hypothetical protein [Natronospira proteinivora]MCP1726203.1 hypothetical protein [Natronospira proteinivora]
MSQGPDLAYLIAVGHRRYRMAARAAVESLLGPGGFDGDVVLFSDRPMRVPEGVRLVTVSDPVMLAQPKRLKFQIGRYVDLAGYRHVMFFDADLVSRGPVLERVAEPLAEGALICTDDIEQTVDQGLCCRCLSEEELKIHGGSSLGVNSGFFAARGELIQDYLSTWEALVDACSDRPGPGFDQPGLNAAMLRAELPVCVVRGLMWFPRRDPDQRLCLSDAPLVHFHGAGRRWGRTFRMRAFARQLA